VTPQAPCAFAPGVFRRQRPHRIKRGPASQTPVKSAVTGREFAVGEHGGNHRAMKAVTID
jgi:hypothetical protein